MRPANKLDQASCEQRGAAALRMLRHYCVPGLAWEDRQAASPAAPAHAGWMMQEGLHSTTPAWVQVDDLVLLHGVDEQTGVYLEAPWNLARVSPVVPRVPKWS